MDAEIEAALRRVLLGESVSSIARDHRHRLLDSVGLREDEASPATFRKETIRFAGRLCRLLADRHAGNRGVAAALLEYARSVDDYEPFDALLAAFSAFEGRDALLRRGKALFPRSLTAHWDER